MSTPISQADDTDIVEKRENIAFAEKDAALREDVRSLGKMVGDMLLEQGGEALYKTVESARRLAILRREGDSEASARLDQLLNRMSAAAARDIVRAFSTYFQVVNTAEQVHRIRRRRDYLKDSNTRQPRAPDTTFAQLNEAGFEAGSVEELLRKIHMQPVFTPHPTETTRRTILRKHQNIVRRMIDMQNPALTPQESDACFENIRADITAIWQTEESPVEGGTVFDELEHTLFFMTDVIYRVIPPFYESLESAFHQIYAGNAPAHVPQVLSFGSWIGGDMSTDKEISARTIRETFARQRALILDLYYNDCRSLAEKLSQSVSRVDVDKTVREQIEAYGKQFPGARGSMPHRYRDMPYRRLLRLICQRLQATYDESAFPYEDAGQFIADLKLIASSLARRKGKHAGLFAVERLIRRAETFGFHFMSVDLRYDAAGLQQVIGYCLGEAGWLEKTPEERATRIQHVLDINDSPTIEPDNNAKRLLAVFGAISYCRRKYGEQAIGVFLVRHCRGTDDILAVLLLARWAGLFSAEGSIPLDICPSFETTAELAISGGLVARLLKNDFYAANLRSLGNHQTVMLSTAGSGMECCFAASRWSTQQAHMQLKEILGAQDIDCTLFHGRGSFSGRGGVADSIACGHLRATEHGESVNERYGVRGIALRTLEKAFNAVIVNTAGLDTTRDDDSAWADIMNTVAGSGDNYYSKLKGDGAEFEQYFRLATPIDVIERMQAKQFSLRGDSDPMANINVPWALAWAQSRYMLPAWFGIGTGLETAFDKYGKTKLRAMLAKWPFFARLIGDAETALAIADTGIALHYSELAGTGLHERFFPVIHEEYRRSISALLELKEQEKLLEANTTLRRSIRLRNPYVDPMSLLQVELLQRWRSGNREDEVLLAALLASVNGISRGLQTSG